MTVEAQMDRRHSERGAQLVEFALTLPLLLLVLAGVADFGLLFHSAEVTTNAAREGARIAVLPGAGVNAAAMAEARVTGYLAAAGLTGAHTTAVAVEPVALNGGLTANGVRVTVTYTYNCLLLGPIVGLVNGTFANAITYQSTALMRIQVPAVVP
jgi:Flp pilus assembly protein TadG